jgi:hypothetical protein
MVMMHEFCICDGSDTEFCPFHGTNKKSVYNDKGEAIGFIMYEAHCVNPECGHGVLSHSVETNECLEPDCSCKKWDSPLEKK